MSEDAHTPDHFPKSSASPGLASEWKGTEENRAAEAARPAIEEPPICHFCDRYTEPFKGHEICNCQGIQPYGLSNYPGEFKMVKAHPANLESDAARGETQYYQRKEIDPLLSELKWLKGATLLFGACAGAPVKVDGIVPSDPTYPEPPADMLASPLFEAIWQAIKGWDIARYGSGGPGPTLYAGPTGNDVMHIILHLGPVLAQEVEIRHIMKGQLEIALKALQAAGAPVEPNGEGLRPDALGEWAEEAARDKANAIR